MDISVLAMLFVFIVLMAINTPISVCIGLATLAAMLATMEPTAAVATIAQRMGGGVNSFTLLAIPFFVLSGHLMGRGGIAHRLIEFAKVLIGWMPGGLALVNVVSCMLFGAISGSAVAATSAIGSFMIPEMNKEGYKKEFNTAVTVTAATTGMLIPPSNILIIYSMASGGVSIGALFIAGYLPGLLMGMLLMIACLIYARKKNYKRGQVYSLKECHYKALDAIPALFLIVIVIGGIIKGVFTATEASVIAVLYALVLSVFIYRNIKIFELPAIFLKSIETTAIVMFLIGASSAMSWMLSYQHIPELLSDALLTLSDNPFVILLLINLLLLLVGTFMDMTPAVLIFTPIFLPVAVQMGISPLHFGIMLVLNLSIGLCTPPVGSVLFVGCSVGKTKIIDMIRPLMPLYAVLFIGLMLITYIPAISEFLPTLLGFSLN